MEIQNIPLNKLGLSPENVRNIKGDVKSLKASIQAIGLLQNLIVKPNGKRGHFEVIAGERRYVALTQLAEEGAEGFTAVMPVPCKVQEKAAQTEASLAENFQREELHPVDEFRAFADLIAEGKTAKEIAQRFGIKVKDVDKRLALAAVHPAILDAYKDDKLLLDEVMAFTVAGSQERQIEVFTKIAGTNQSHNRAAWIKRLLTEEAVSASCGLVKFVTLKAYKAAGGTVLQDLFSNDDHTYINDRELLNRLADEKLAAVIEEAKAEGFKWVRGDLERDFEFIRECKELDPAPVKMTKKLQAKLDAMNARLDSLRQADELTDEEWHEMERLEEQAEGIGFAYTPKQKAESGLYLYIDGNGEVGRVEYLQDRDDAKEAAQTEREAATSGSEETVPEKGDKPWSAALRSDLRAARNQIVQAHVARDFPMAFDVMLHSLIVRHLGLGASGIVQLSVTEQDARSGVEDLDKSPAGQLLAESKAKLAAVFDLDDPAAEFDAIRALTTEEKQAWFAFLVATAIKPQLNDDSHGRDDRASNPVYERVGGLLGIDMPAFFRATETNLFNRITKANLLTIASEAIDEAWSASRADSKKSDLAAEMGRKFSPVPTDSRNTQQQQARIDAWTPGVMAFPKADA